MLRELFIEELNTFPGKKTPDQSSSKNEESCYFPGVSNGFENHLPETEEQIGAVEKVFELLYMMPLEKKWEVMSGLVKEAE